MAPAARCHLLLHLHCTRVSYLVLVCFYHASFESWPKETNNNNNKNNNNNNNNNNIPILRGRFCVLKMTELELLLSNLSPPGGSEVCRPSASAWPRASPRRSRRWARASRVSPPAIETAAEQPGAGGRSVVRASTRGSLDILPSTSMGAASSLATSK